MTRLENGQFHSEFVLEMNPALNYHTCSLAMRPIGAASFPAPWYRCDRCVADAVAITGHGKITDPHLGERSIEVPPRPVFEDLPYWSEDRRREDSE